MEDQIPKQEQRIAGLTKAEFEAKSAEHTGGLKIYGVTMDGQDFDLIARKPSRAEADQHMVDLSKAKDRNVPMMQPMRNFVRLVTVAPDETTLDAYFERYPLVVSQVYEQVMKEVGADAEVREKTFR